MSFLALGILALILVGSLVAIVVYLLTRGGDEDG